MPSVRSFSDPSLLGPLGPLDWGGVLYIGWTVSQWPEMGRRPRIGWPVTVIFTADGCGGRRRGDRRWSGGLRHRLGACAPEPERPAAPGGGGAPAGGGPPGDPPETTAP